MSAQKTKDREEYAYFSDSYFKLEYNAMFVRNENLERLKKIKSLKSTIDSNFKFGITRGPCYIQRIRFS